MLRTVPPRGLPDESCPHLPVVFAFVSVRAEISNRRPSGPVTLTGGASPLSTITTCSQAASWWSCSPSCCTCCGSGAFTDGHRAALRPPPSGWRKAFRPRRLPVPCEREFESPARLSEGKAIFCLRVSPLYSHLVLFFLSQFLFLETKTKSIVCKLCCPRSVAFSRFAYSFKLRSREKGKSLHSCCIGWLPKTLFFFEVC